MYRPRAGVYALQQPVMQQVFPNTRQTGDVLLTLAGKSDTFKDYLQSHWRAAHARAGHGKSFDDAWNDALQHGGVQRLFTGNIATGAHSLVVSVNGKTQFDKDFSRTETFAFSKGVEPKLLGITLSGPESIQLGDW